MKKSPGSNTWGFFCYTLAYMSFLKLYLIALPIFFVLDMVWLGVVAKNFYRSQLGGMMRADVQWVPAIAFYLLFIAGLVAFVISPAVARQSWQYALGMGALFGLVTYATYDLTNLATLKNWPITMTLVDLVWGAVLAGAISVLTYIVASKV